MIDFTTLQGLTIPEGVVTQIEDASGRVLWAVMPSGVPVILEVEKITSSTYAGETTYANEQFILLDIYPKTNGTVKVTYGGVTKTIKDTSGAENPNAQQVFFGTFNGVSDSVATPASGTLKISGDYSAFGCGAFNGSASKSSETGYYTCCCIAGIVDWGEVEYIPLNAFTTLSTAYAKGDAYTKITSVTIPNSITSVPENAFANCTGLTDVVISDSVTLIGAQAFYNCGNLTSVTFENTEGWRKWNGPGYDYWDVSDPAANAEELKNNYIGDHIRV